MEICFKFRFLSTSTLLGIHISCSNFNGHVVFNPKSKLIYNLRKTDCVALKMIFYTVSKKDCCRNSFSK